MTRFALLAPLLAAPAPDVKNSWSVKELAAHLAKRGLRVKAVLPARRAWSPWEGYYLVFEGDCGRARAERLDRSAHVEQGREKNQGAILWPGVAYVARAPDEALALAWRDNRNPQRTHSSNWHWGRFYFAGDVKTGRRLKAALGWTKPGAAPNPLR